MRTRSLLLAASCLLVACSSPVPAAPSGTWAYGPEASAALVVEVYKSPTCSCCHEWEAYLRARGYTVRSVPTVDMAAVKAQRGVPIQAASCHTAVVAGYVVEGHVPVDAIHDLLETRPAIDGIALPGMPAGSPGMPGEQAEPFEVLAIADGAVSTFGAY